MFLRGMLRSARKLVRYESSANLTAHNIIIERLENRAILHISGTNVADYLQGLITNDINHLSHGSRSMYALFLNSKGRVLYDTIIYKSNDDEYTIECDKEISNDLKAHINLYKVRRKIAVTALVSATVWNINSHEIVNRTFNKNHIDLNPLLSTLNAQGFCTAYDPRVPILGLRSIDTTESNIVKTLENFLQNVSPSNNYQSARYNVGVAEGPVELPVGNCFPLEANCDFMHGISFHKGCYIGQELTARTYHTGAIRKRIMPMLFNEDVTSIPVDTAIFSEGNDKTLGKLRGLSGRLGIGLLRIDDCLKSTNLHVQGFKFKTFRPPWWPNEAPKERIRSS